MGNINLKIIGCWLLVCLLLGPGLAQGAFITFHGETSLDLGSGFGNVLTILVLQPGGSTTSEWGSVSWNGSNDVESGDALSNSQTQTVTDLIAAGFDEENLLVVLNLNQTGNSDGLDVHDFTVQFFDTDGTVLFEADYVEGVPGPNGNTAPSTGLNVNGQGIGSAGFVFRISFEGTQGSDFFAQGSNRIGLTVESANAIDNEANDGPETFYIADANVNTVVPEPATLAILLIGGLALLRRRK